MSYTPYNEQIDDTIDDLLESIEKLNSITSARIRSDSYNQEHLIKLSRIRNSLNDISLELMELK